MQQYATMFFFTEPDKITAQTPTYGKMDADNYQITTQFSLAPGAKAFACQDSLIIVLPSTDPTLVNKVNVFSG